MSEGDSFVLEAPVQHGAELLLVLGVELEHGDLLAAVLLDVLQPHQGLELRDGPRGVQVSLGEQQQHWGGLQAGLVQQLCNKNISQKYPCVSVTRAWALCSPLVPSSRSDVLPMRLMVAWPTLSGALASTQ